MRKKNPPIIICVFLLAVISGVAIFFVLSPAQAITFKPSVTIPGLPSEITIRGDSIGLYISAIYKYAIGIVGIVATVVLMFGGVTWITAGGSAERIGSAKAWIGASLTGLALVLASYMIMNTVNPDLVIFKPVRPVTISSSVQCCSALKGPFGGFSSTVNGSIVYSCAIPANLSSQEKANWGAVSTCMGNQICTMSTSKQYLCLDSTGKCSGDEGCPSGSKCLPTLKKCTDGLFGSPCEKKSDCKAKYSLCNSDKACDLAM